MSGLLIEVIIRAEILSLVLLAAGGKFDAILAGVEANAVGVIGQSPALGFLGKGVATNSSDDYSAHANGKKVTAPGRGGDGLFIFIHDNRGSVQQTGSGGSFIF